MPIQLQKQRLKGRGSQVGSLVHHLQLLSSLEYGGDVFIENSQS
ncbi:hypothetical protein [uncultured Nostoc sp.]